jgi:hypothetical protein
VGPGDKPIAITFVLLEGDQALDNVERCREREWHMVWVLIARSSRPSWWKDGAVSPMASKGGWAEGNAFRITLHHNGHYWARMNDRPWSAWHLDGLGGEIVQDAGKFAPRSPIPASSGHPRWNDNPSVSPVCML